MSEDNLVKSFLSFHLSLASEGLTQMPLYRAKYLCLLRHLTGLSFSLLETVLQLVLRPPWYPSLGHSSLSYLPILFAFVLCSLLACCIVRSQGPGILWVAWCFIGSLYFLQHTWHLGLHLCPDQLMVSPQSLQLHLLPQMSLRVLLPRAVFLFLNVIYTSMISSVYLFCCFSEPQVSIAI